jgi:hypothetical protein
MSFWEFLFGKPRDYAQEWRDYREIDRQLRKETKDLPRYPVKCAISECSNTIHILERDRRYYESAARQPVLCGPCEYRKSNSRKGE